jgi:hypothetical protein
MSIGWGMGPERTIYKQAVPRSYQDEVCNFELRALTDKNPDVQDCRNNVATGPDDPANLTPSECVSKECQPSCVDSDYTACVLPNSMDDWNSVNIYRPYYDVRRCEGTPTTPDGNSFDLNATYDWMGDIILGNAPPDPNVIYQGMTHQVFTNLWANCVNGGFDPPAHYTRDYKGPQTGAITDTTLCAPPWWRQTTGGNSDAPPVGCSSAADKNERFPKRTE